MSLVLSGVGLAALQLCLIFSHVAWRDETQALMVASRTANLDALFKALHREGHPALWYLSLRLIGSVIPGVAALRASEAAISLATLFLILTRAPFALPVRILTALGYFFLFEYGVIARSYSLGALLFMTWLCARSPLWKAGLILLLTQISVHFALLAGAAVALDLASQRRISWPQSAALAFGAVLFLATIWPQAGTYPGVPRSPYLVANIWEALKWLSTGVFPVWVGHFTWGEALPDPISQILGLALCPVGLAALGGTGPTDRIRQRAWLGLYLALLGFSSLVYVAYSRHVGVLVLWLVGLLWRKAEESGEIPNRAALAWLWLQALCGCWMAMNALLFSFSAGDRAVWWIRRYPIPNAHLAVYPGWHAPDLAARLGEPVIDLKSDRLIFFEPWDRPSAPLEDQHRTRRLLERAARTFGPRLLIYADANNMTLEQSGAHRLKAFPGSLQGGAMALFFWRAPRSMGLEPDAASSEPAKP